MFLELPVTLPPNVKALMVKVVALYGEMVVVRRPVVAVMVVLLRPLERSREPVKAFDAIAVERKTSAVVIALVA